MTFDRFGRSRIFGLGEAQDGPRRPKTAQDGPRCPQYRPKAAQEAPKTAPRRPKKAPRRPKRALRQPKRAPRLPEGLEQLDKQGSEHFPLFFKSPPGPCRDRGLGVGQRLLGYPYGYLGVTLQSLFENTVELSGAVLELSWAVFMSLWLPQKRPSKNRDPMR